MIPCPNHPDQIMEARETRYGPGVNGSFVCARCEEERVVRIKEMFPPRGEFGAPVAFQGPRAANDTPSLQEILGVDKIELPEREVMLQMINTWRGRAEIAEKKLAAFQQQLDRGWRMVPYEPTEHMINAIVKLKQRRVYEAINHGTEGPGAAAAAREEWFRFLGFAPWPDLEG